MKDLVQELREASGRTTGACSTLARIAGTKKDCVSIRCSSCMEHTLNALADRIEREYERRPEPDTVEKVALDMVAWFDNVIEACKSAPAWITDEAAAPFRERLEALGVTFDE